MNCPNCNYICDDQDRYCAHCGTPLFQIVREKKGRHWVPIVIMVLLFSFGTGLFFALPGGSAGSNGSVTGEMPWFQIDDGVLSFNKALYDGGSELQIPESINGIPVTAISDSCFENCTNLTGIVFPASLLAIGEDAFRGCTALRGVEIPDSVRLIGAGTFADCTALEAVCIHSGIKSIGPGAFNNCTKLFYIYYVGYYQDWTELYGEFINPYTAVICEDGSFYQGGDTN